MQELILLEIGCLTSVHIPMKCHVMLKNFSEDFTNVNVNAKLIIMTCSQFVLVWNISS